MKQFTQVFLFSFLLFQSAVTLAIPPVAQQAGAIKTPGHKHSEDIFFGSPDSNDRQNVIYLIHDLPDTRKELLQFETKLDFGNRELSAGEFLAEIAPIREKVEELKSLKLLHSFHRYIGKVSEGMHGNRVTTHRDIEHLRECNSVTKISNTRLCLGLRLSAALKQEVHRTVLIYGVHANQLGDFESYLIDLFGGLEDLGWNSNQGNCQSALCKKLGPAGEVGRELFFDPTDEDEAVRKSTRKRKKPDWYSPS